MIRFIRVCVPNQEEWIAPLIIESYLSASARLLGPKYTYKYAYGIQKIPLFAKKDGSKIGACYIVCVLGRKYQMKLIEEYSVYEKYGWKILRGLFGGKMIVKVR